MTTSKKSKRTDMALRAAALELAMSFNPVSAASAVEIATTLTAFLKGDE